VKERERIRKMVNKIVRHIADPAKRARMIRVLTQQYTVLAMIDREAGLAY
jgi:hypothetical protein